MARDERHERWREQASDTRGPTRTGGFGFLRAHPWWSLASAAAAITLGNPARADVLSPETGTDEAVLGQAQSSPWNPTIATDGAGALAVWEDYRLGGGDLFAARLTATGASLDPVGLPVALGTAVRHHGAKLAFDGARFWLAWVREGATAREVVLARWSGTRLADDPAFTVHAGVEAALACRSDGCLVAWSETLTAPLAGSRVAFTRVSAAGALLDAPGVTLAEGQLNPANPVVIGTTDGYLIGWAQCASGMLTCSSTAAGTWDTDLQVARISASGAVLDPNGLAVATGPEPQRLPALAWSGSAALVAWQQDGSASTVPSTVLARRLLPDGTSLDPSPIAMPSPLSTQLTPWSSQWAPTATWTGTSFMVGYVADGGDAAAVQTIASDGSVSGERIFTRVSGLRSFVTASAGTTVWGAWASPYEGLFAGRLDAASQPERRLTESGNRQVLPRSASDGEHYLVVWQDYREPPYLGILFRPSLYATRVGGDGRVVSGPALRVAPGAPADVAFDGSAYVVVTTPTTEQGSVVGLRIARDGTMPSTGPVFQYAPPPQPTDAGVDQGPTSTSEARIASAGGGSLVVWASGAGSPQLLGWRLDAAALPIGDPVVLAPTTAAPHVATSAGRYLVVYQAATTEARGVLADAGTYTPITPFPSGYLDDIAGGSSGFLVLSWDGSGSRAALLSPEGNVVRSDLLLPPNGARAGASRAIWDGTSFVVASVEGDPGDFYLTRILPDGSILPSLHVAASGVPNPDSPVLASSGAGTTLVSYSRFDPGAPFGERRIRSRLLSGSPLIGDGGAVADAGRGADAAPPDASSLARDAARGDAAVDAVAAGSAGIPPDASDEITMTEPSRRGLDDRVAPVEVSASGGCACTVVKSLTDAPETGCLTCAVAAVAAASRRRGRYRSAHG